jgi:hypothetical protein
VPLSLYEAMGGSVQEQIKTGVFIEERAYNRWPARRRRAPSLHRLGVATEALAGCGGLTIRFQGMQPRP